jgi:hypothetical protein
MQNRAGESGGESETETAERRGQEGQVHKTITTQPTHRLGRKDGNNTKKNKQTTADDAPTEELCNMRMRWVRKAESVRDEEGVKRGRRWSRNGSPAR